MNPISVNAVQKQKFLLIVAVSAIFAVSSRSIIDMKILPRTVFTIAQVRRNKFP